MLSYAPDLERASIRLSQAFEIAKKYNNPDYSLNEDKNSDISQGSIFIYEALKNGKDFLFQD